MELNLARTVVNQSSLKTLWLVLETTSCISISLLNLAPPYILMVHVLQQPEFPVGSLGVHRALKRSGKLLDSNTDISLGIMS